MAERQGIWQTTFVVRPDKPIVPGSTAPDAKESDQAVVGGWQKYELFREERGELLPRLTLHDGKVFLLYANTDGSSVQVRAYTPGTGWKDLSKIPRMFSSRPPALVSHGGKLHAFAMYNNGTGIAHAVMDSTGAWTTLEDRQENGPGGSMLRQQINSDYMPGAAVHDGKIHLVTYSERWKRLSHSVFGADNERSHNAQIPTAVAAPTSRMSLLSYEGKLHLIFTEDDLLKHFTYDGTAWQPEPDGPKTGTSQFAPDSTVYDGKIYTAYSVQEVTQVPAAELFDREIARAGLGWRTLSSRGGQLPLAYDTLVKADEEEPEAITAMVSLVRESGRAPGVPQGILDGIEDLAGYHERVAFMKSDEYRERMAEDPDFRMEEPSKPAPLPETWQVTEDRVGYQTYDADGWSGEVILPVHANTPPSVVAYEEPDDPDSGRLLLVYSGVESYIPPPPPPQPVGALITGSRVSHGRTDYGNGHYAKVNHSINAQLHRNPAGATHIKAWWSADVFKVSDWFGITTRDGGHVSGKIKLTRGAWLVTDHHFTAEIVDGQVTIAKTHRTGGYYFPHSVDQPLGFEQV